MSAATTVPHSQDFAEQRHHCAADVAKALLDPNRIGLGMTPHRYLPLFAVVAIDRIDADSALRNTAMLDELLQAYAKTAGKFVDLESCAAAHRIAALRFQDFRG